MHWNSVCLLTLDTVGRSAVIWDQSNELGDKQAGNRSRISCLKRLFYYTTRKKAFLDLPALVHVMILDLKFTLKCRANAVQILLLTNWFGVWIESRVEMLISNWCNLGKFYNDDNGKGLIWNVDVSLICMWECVNVRGLTRKSFG